MVQSFIFFSFLVKLHMEINDDCENGLNRGWWAERGTLWSGERECHILGKKSSEPNTWFKSSLFFFRSSYFPFLIPFTFLCLNQTALKKYEAESTINVTPAMDIDHN